ncbi:hypothetical protein SKAU_G00102060 [Synaphobranchus kaupii]|uniref:Uncharacterized protein n=1 Tax=Synaphobranchus kaupii TaxID=118154 RepID=A0A9Q1FYL6_SYNKA|nr:hypothetical protein SKAU_G00102060 [Synaphobranchus kaupii]
MVWENKALQNFLPTDPGPPVLAGPCMSTAVPRILQNPALFGQFGEPELAVGFSPCEQSIACGLRLRNPCEIIDDIQ